MTLPVFDEEEAEEGTAKVCEMRHIVAWRTKCHRQFNAYVNDDEPLCLDGYGKWENENALFREAHAES